MITCLNKKTVITCATGGTSKVEFWQGHGLPDGIENHIKIRENMLEEKHLGPVMPEVEIEDQAEHEISTAEKVADEFPDGFKNKPRPTHDEKGRLITYAKPRSRRTRRKVTNFTKPKKKRK